MFGGMEWNLSSLLQTVLCSVRTEV
jgi:hypothetical protein